MIKPIEILDGLLIVVSDDGRVFTRDHTSLRSNGRVDNRKGRELKPAYDRYGYKRVVFSHNGKRKTCLVHRLVAEAFIPNPKSKPTVNHKNDQKDDNRVENLEWATQREQKAHSIQHHLCDKNIRALQEANRRTSRKVKVDGKMFDSIRGASRILGVSEWKVRKEGVFYD